MSILTAKEITGGHRLWVTDFRYRRGRSVPPSNTTFDVTNAAAEGLPGLTYQSQQAKAIIALPDYDVDPDAYCEMMAHYNLSREQVEAWSRQARSYFAIPIELALLDGFAILSVDCEDPLDGLGDDDLKELLQKLTAAVDERLALLLQLFSASTL